MDEQTVELTLNWTYGVPHGRQTVYYGPGRVEVPLSVARQLGYTAQPIESITTEALAAALRDSGFATVDDISRATIEQLTAVSGVGDKTAEKLLKAAAGGNTE